MKSREVSMETVIYRPVLGSAEEVEIEVEVTGTLEPYFKGSWDEPPSGGGVDDVQATCWDGKKAHDIPLTADEIRTFADQLAESSVDDYEPDDFDDRRYEE